MALFRGCDICTESGDGRKVTRYTLSRKEHVNGAIENHSLGGIDLCDACWHALARPRMRDMPGFRYACRSVVCSRCSSDGSPYGLKISKRVNGKVVTRGAGGITLCAPCWSATAKSVVRKERELKEARNLMNAVRARALGRGR